mmetsp:Transcript_15634/g.37141  ORF Transcript_15634/g.37141 Transcript_15634/m.37141 type:complete len:209 (-) Transcript_15634:1345-1971(-)
MLTFQGRADFVVNWRPFQLNPSASREGVNKLEMYREKFGEERLRQIMPRLTQVFAEEGLKYSLGGLTGNTLNSHRLVAAAERVGLGSALVEELMKGYFTEEKFINDREFLLETASKVGLPDAESVVNDETVRFSASPHVCEARKKTTDRHISASTSLTERTISAACPEDVPRAGRAGDEGVRRRRARRPLFHYRRQCGDQRRAGAAGV